jgi:hypothetical protein
VWWRRVFSKLLFGSYFQNSFGLTPFFQWAVKPQWI